MSDDHVAFENLSDDAPQRRRRVRFAVAAACLSFVLLLVAVVALNLFYSLPLRISKETTYIIEPLTPDGKRVDYFAAVQQMVRPDNFATDENGYRLIVRHLGNWDDAEPEHFAKMCQALGLSDEAVVSDMTLEDPYRFLYAYVTSNESDEALLGRFSPEGQSERSLAAAFQDKLDQPWMLDELPMMAEWLHENSPALDLVGLAVRQPEFYIPLVRKNDDPILWSTISSVEPPRAVARALVARTNHRIAVGDIDGAADDIITCKRLGRHLVQGPYLIDMLVGLAIEAMADATGIAGSLEHAPTRQQIQRLIDEVEQLQPEPDFDRIIRAERFGALDLIQELSYRSELWSEVDVFFDGISSKLLAKFGYDWSVLAKRFNEGCDTALTTGTVPAFHLPTDPLTLLSLVSRHTRSEYFGDHLAATFVPSCESAHEAVRRNTCREQMRRIVLAMLLYECDHGTLPPAYSVDTAGNPLHSWRVLLLPYLGHQQLYEQIRLDEPWDSEHNRQYHAAAPAVFRCPSHVAAKPDQTTYSVVVGSDMPFEAGEGKPLAHFGPHSNDMILLVERGNAVCWMDPTHEITQSAAEEGIQRGELAASASSGSDHITSHHEGGAYFGLRSGAVQFLTENIDRELFTKMLKGTHEEKSR